MTLTERIIKMTLLNTSSATEMVFKENAEACMRGAMLWIEANSKLLGGVREEEIAAIVAVMSAEALHYIQEHGMSITVDPKGPKDRSFQ